MIISRHEAAQIQTGRMNVLRRAWNAPRYKKGDKVPVVLEPGGKAPFVLEIIGVISHKLEDMTEARAKEEGFSSLSEWRSHWERLPGVEGTNRVNGNTVIYAHRFRKTDLVHKRRNVLDAPV
jgi:hypothetical protein